ncbi:hypothetical protein FAES_0609 [Fibrella aestuarina BUZ 2]|uniref:DUF306 domain-containing protein n=1 Tax=Fibrella aestuarina BUZ 2 TaxID=1166018 RepID=I0K3B7_9BACT|nr:META domain-containing protein [Fibrella aestuarina]CCG98620.1 hypothetical protein FAES_0609 [Fibrella aestuarina BUZ 2]
MKALVFIWLSVLLLGSCRSGDAVRPTGSSTLVGDWKLVDPNSAYTVTLRIEEQPVQLAGFDSFKLSGRAPVNAYFADANISKGPSIESGEAGTGGIGNLGSTLVAGPADAMRYEDTYLTRLRNVTRAEVTSNDLLYLTYTAVTPGILIYQRQ